MKQLSFVLGVIYFLQFSLADEEHPLSLTVLTVATQKTDGYRRFMQYAQDFNLSVEVVGMGKTWTGGDIANYPGGGQKINLLKPVVKKWKDDKNTLVMFTDSYDVIIADGEDSIISKFRDFNAQIVFSAEGFCWPDRSLAPKYPKVALGKRFLCSGGFIGYGNVVHDIIWDHEIKDTDDDQLYYTEIYLDESKRSDFGMKLDHRSHIFQNLNGAQEEVEIKYEDDKSVGHNVVYGTKPAIFHGNGPSKIFLNYLSNYIGSSWVDGVSQRTLQDMKEVPKDLPSIFLAVYINYPTPFLLEFFKRLENLNYPKKKIIIFVWNHETYHDKVVREWLKSVTGQYKAIFHVEPEQDITPATVRVEAIQECLRTESDYLLAVDSISMVTNVDLIQKLLQFDKDVVAPVIHRPNKLWSNFWGAVASDGFYARSPDYSDIVGREVRGLWNVPHIVNIHLMNAKWLKQNKPKFESESFDVDLSFSWWMRKNGHFMYVTNMEEYGHLVNPEDYSTEHLNNDMYEIFSNRKDWEAKYIHPDWSKLFEENAVADMPCPDVYWFPLMTEAFTKELVGEMEHFGGWSAGKHEDARLSGGYENVPTQDIHMNQVGFDDHWLELLKMYVVPVAEKLFPGYYSKGVAIMNFVVRYHPDAQYYLRPHHDASTYTINVALSRPGIDHWGGGCRFLRYNCSVVDTKLGWALMHPGRLTHYHEGLPTVNGTRYIMVSFIDP
jgi:hypothetical protein